MTTNKKQIQNLKDQTRILLKKEYKEKNRDEIVISWLQGKLCAYADILQQEYDSEYCIERILRENN